MAKLTIKTLNAALKAAGHSEELVKGDGYFYFTGGKSHEWFETMVSTAYKLNDLTLEMWLAEHETLRNQTF